VFCAPSIARLVICARSRPSPECWVGASWKDLLILEVDWLLWFVVPPIDLDHLPRDAEYVDDGDDDGDYSEDLPESGSSLYVIRMDCCGGLRGGRHRSILL